MARFYPFWIKIYEEHYGPLPKDSEGRKYEVHHKDGNRDNNTHENLEALSIEQHFVLHYNQKDWLACLGLAKRLYKYGYYDISEFQRIEKDLKKKSKNLTENCLHCGGTYKSLNWGILKHISRCKKNPANNRKSPPDDEPWDDEPWDAPW